MKNNIALLLLLTLAVFARGQSHIFSTVTDRGGQPLRIEPLGGALGTAVDSAGNIYITSLSLGELIRVSPAGVPGTVASGFGALAGSNFFLGLGDVAIGPNGTVYVSDYGRHVIEQITPTGVRSILAGSPGIAGAADGNGSAARFNRPLGLAVDRAGNLYLSEYSNPTIRKISPTGEVVTLAGRAGFPGNADGVGTAAQFRNPDDLAVDAAGNVFVADTGDNSIRKITPEGLVTTLAIPDGQPGLLSPTGLAIDSVGNLYIAETRNATVRQITPAGEWTIIGGQFAQPGSLDGIGGAARFRNPRRIAIDHAGTLYITDHAFIRKGIASNAPAPPIITGPVASSKLATAVGGETTFAASATGAPPLSYQWLKNSVRIPGAVGATLSITRATAADTGTYTVAVTNPAGTAVSLPTTYTVNVPLTTSFTQRHARAGGNFLWSLASGNGLLVAVGTNGTILTSADGQTWTPRNSGTNDWLVGVTFGNGLFVIVGDRGRILVSSDGASWTGVTATGTTQRLNNVLYARDTFVAVGEAGAIVTSPDGRVWTARRSGVTGWLRGLAYGEATGLFATAGRSGTFLTSNDGVEWTPVVSSDLRFGDIEAIAAVGSYADFVGVGSFGNVVFLNRISPESSPLASSQWGTGLASTGARRLLRGLAQGASALFATGEAGVIATAPSVYGPWITLPTGTTANLVSGLYVGDTLYVVGENETVLQSDSLYFSRLQNISTRALVGTGGNAMFSGFVIAGPQPKQVLLRAAGPALAGFGVTGTLATPVLTLFDRAGQPVAANTGWTTAANFVALSLAATRVGAFPFAANARDSALLVTLPPGLYNAQVAGSGDTSGVALVEAYDAEPISNTASRAINISTRAHVGAGQDRIFAGFVIGGAAARRVLIRAVGPGLTAFGVAGVLAEPQLELYNATGTLQLGATAWNVQSDDHEIRTAATAAGAFAFAEGSKDSAVVATLLPGQWTVQVSGANNTTGVALVEIYDLP